MVRQVLASAAPRKSCLTCSQGCARQESLGSGQQAVRRKRPALIPVRDRVVVREHGLANHDSRSDWLVFRYLLQDADVLGGLDQAASRATAEHRTDLSRIPGLRLLETLMWMMRP